MKRTGVAARSKPVRASDPMYLDPAVVRRRAAARRRNEKRAAVLTRRYERLKETMERLRGQPRLSLARWRRLKQQAMQTVNGLLCTTCADDERRALLVELDRCDASEHQRTALGIYLRAHPERETPAFARHFVSLISPASAASFIPPYGAEEPAYQVALGRIERLLRRGVIDLCTYRDRRGPQSDA